jgi:hypothetical protein
MSQSLSRAPGAPLPRFSDHFLECFSLVQKALEAKDGKSRPRLVCRAMAALAHAREASKADYDELRKICDDLQARVLSGTLVFDERIKKIQAHELHLQERMFAAYKLVMTLLARLDVPEKTARELFLLVDAHMETCRAEFYPVADLTKEIQRRTLEMNDKLPGVEEERARLKGGKAKVLRFTTHKDEVVQ